jgi:hypothetical protein
MRCITTLLSPADSYDLVTLDVVKAELQLTDDASDPWLKTAITQVSAAMARFCNRSNAIASEASFAVETVQDLFYPERDAYPFQVPGGASVLQLSHWPVTNILEVNITDPAGATPQILVADTDYVLDASVGQLIRLDAFMAYPTQWVPIRTAVKYSGGFDPIPDDVVDAALRWVTMRWSDRGRDPNLKSLEQPMVGTKTYWVGAQPMTEGVPTEIASLLIKYRVPVSA